MCIIDAFGDQNLHLDRSISLNRVLRWGETEVVNKPSSTEITMHLCQQINVSHRKHTIFYKRVMNGKKLYFCYTLRSYVDITCRSGTVTENICFLALNTGYILSTKDCGYHCELSVTGTAAVTFYFAAINYEIVDDLSLAQFIWHPSDETRSLQSNRLYITNRL